MASVTVAEPPSPLSPTFVCHLPFANIRDVCVVSLATLSACAVRISGVRQSAGMWAKSKYKICMNCEWNVNDGRREKKTNMKNWSNTYAGHAVTHRRTISSFHIFFPRLLLRNGIYFLWRSSWVLACRRSWRLSWPLRRMWGALGTALSTRK